MPPILHFLGAAGSVTGSKFLMVANGKEVLVDAGLFQGRKKLRERNWDRMPIDPRKIDAAVMTHGHIDHVGYLPRLVKQGFRGPVFCTPATAELMQLLLPDSAHIQEEEARYANKKGYSRHKPALPLYTASDAIDALKQIETYDYGEDFSPAAGFDAWFHPSGHILGSAFLEMVVDGVRTVFSGDIGGYDDAIMRPPVDIPDGTDYILVESTYGGRAPTDDEPVQDQMRRHLKPCLDNDGVVVIPAFAVGRTTLVLFHLRQLMERGEIPKVPVFVDSPMATDAVELYCRFASLHNLRVELLRDTIACPIRPPDIHLIKKVEHSKKLNSFRGPGVIISASGMATGGRILHHLKRRLPYRSNLVLLVGYQAHGTRGRMLLEGAEEIKIHGSHHRVHAKVASIRGLSAHGDSDEVMRWLGTARDEPKKIFLVHGEEKGLAAMAARVDDELGHPHHTPDYMEKVTLS